LDKLLGQIFISKGYLTQKQVETVIVYSKEKGIKFASAVVELNYCSEKEALICLIEQMGVPGIHFADSSFKFLNKIIPFQIAIQRLILPIKDSEKNIIVVMANPFDKVLIDEINFITGKKVIPYISVENILKKVINLCFNSGKEFYGQIEKGEYFDMITPVISYSENEDITKSNISINQLITSESENNLFFQTSITEINTVLNKKKVVLIVDDEEDILKLVSKIVAKAGFDYLTINNGSEAIPLITKHKPDLIILDAMLPGVHGFDICKQIKSSDLAYIPVLIVSAIYKGWEFETEIINIYKADKFIEKPFRVNLLMDLIKELLSKNNDRDKMPVEQNIDEIIKKVIEYIKNNNLYYAKKTVEESITLSPFCYKLKYILGYIYMQMNEYLLAINEFEACLNINKSFYFAAKDLAIAYEKVGFRNRAIENWLILLNLIQNEEQKEAIKKHLVNIISNT